MALPKKNKKNINIVTKPIQGEYPSGYNGIAVPNRRKELSELIDRRRDLFTKISITR